MATLADLLLELRDGGFSPYDHPDAKILRWANRTVPRISEEIGKYREDLVLVTSDITIATHDFDAGHDVSGISFILPLGGDVKYPAPDAIIYPLTFVSSEERNSKRYRYGAYLDDQTVFLLGYDGWWQDVETVTLRFQKKTTDLTARTSNIDLPGDPIDALVSLYGGGEGAAYDDYLNRITGRNRVEIHQPELS